MQPVWFCSALHMEVWYIHYTQGSNIRAARLLLGTKSYWMVQHHICYAPIPPALHIITLARQLNSGLSSSILYVLPPTSYAIYLRHHIFLSRLTTWQQIQIGNFLNLETNMPHHFITDCWLHCALCWLYIMQPSYALCSTASSLVGSVASSPSPSYRCHSFHAFHCSMHCMHCTTIG